MSFFWLLMRFSLNCLHWSITILPDFIVQTDMLSFASIIKGNFLLDLLNVSLVTEFQSSLQYDNFNNETMSFWRNYDYTLILIFIFWVYSSRWVITHKSYLLRRYWHKLIFILVNANIPLQDQTWTKARFGFLEGCLQHISAMKKCIQLSCKFNSQLVERRMIAQQCECT